MGLGLGVGVECEHDHDRYKDVRDDSGDGARQGTHLVRVRVRVRDGVRVRVRGRPTVRVRVRGERLAVSGER